MGWYVAKTHYHQELLAKNELLRQGIRSFVPRYSRTRKVRYREVRTVRPLFPGYIFPQFDIGEDSWRFINSTYGIRKLMPVWCEFPTPVNDEIIESLLARCDGEDLLLDEVVAIEKIIPIGAIVRIDSGPLEGHFGEVNMADENRISVVVQIFGRPSSIWMGSDAVTVVQ